MKGSLFSSKEPYSTLPHNIAPSGVAPYKRDRPAQPQPSSTSTGEPKRSNTPTGQLAPSDELLGTRATFATRDRYKAVTLYR